MQFGIDQKQEESGNIYLKPGNVFLDNNYSLYSPSSDVNIAGNDNLL